MTVETAPGAGTAITAELPVGGAATVVTAPAEYVTSSVGP